MRSLFQGGAESDLRFQFEVIRNLSESVRQSTDATRDLAKNMAEMQKTQVSMLERLAKLEANRVNESVAKVEERLDNACKAIDKLETERDVREGGSKAWRGFLAWWGPLTWTLGIVFTVLFLLFRATGILHLPDGKETPVAIQREERAVEEGKRQ